MQNIPDLQNNIYVVIPVYNCEKYLETAVRSVLSQPYRGIHIILVDDGSTDSSPQICDRLSLIENIHVIHQSNRGVAAARNTGIDYVLGENANVSPGGYIAFLDADDKWESDFFCDRIMALIKRGYSCLGFQSCHCDSSMLWRDVPYELNAGMHLGGKDIVWTHSAQHFGAMLYSCQLLREYEIRFIEGLKYTEDKIFRMQCMYLAKQVWLENQLLYYYRATPDSAIHKRKHGIEHFTPIIEGWLTSDHTMQRWKNAARGQLCAGRELASIYVMDMISEHYQCFRTAKDITRLLQEKP